MNDDPRHSEHALDSSTNPDERLDQLLVDWGASRSSSRDSADELRARIVSQLADGSPVTDRSSVELSAANRPRSSGWLFAGIAAVVLLVVTLSLRKPADKPDVAKQDASSVAALAQFAPHAADATEKALLFDELERMFGGKLCWVAETDNNIRLGMCPSGVLVEKRYPAVSVRLTVVRRTTGQQQWSRVWSMDVTMRGQQVVRTGSSDTNVALWVYRMPDGMLAVDSDLTLSGPVRLQTSYSGIQQFGVPSEIHSGTIDDLEYAVFQTIVLLDPTDDIG